MPSSLAFASAPTEVDGGGLFGGPEPLGRAIAFSDSRSAAPLSANLVTGPWRSLASWSVDRRMRMVYPACCFDSGFALASVAV